MEPEDYLAYRAAYSAGKLAEFREAVASDVITLRSLPNLCIYVTGSYGRHEAGPNSDLDLFTMYSGDAPSTEEAKSLTDGLKKVAAALGHQEFTKDGKYLVPHAINDLSEKIGSQDEDSENIFTARMLLLLESEPIFNDQLHTDAVFACINEYCRDFTKHPADFYPRFFANDIMRYWKTLCLNYENRRTKRDDGEKAKHRLKNYKLKFSRMMICFSMIACLCDRRESDSPGKLVGLAKMKPRVRLQTISGRHDLGHLFGQLVNEYTWFLQSTDQNEARAEAWLADNKDDAFRHASTFGDTIYRLLEQVAKAARSDLRYLVV